jgi:hypothetical protein
MTAVWNLQYLRKYKCGTTDVLIIHCPRDAGGQRACVLILGNSTLSVLLFTPQAGFKCQPQTSCPDRY